MENHEPPKELGTARIAPVLVLAMSLVCLSQIRDAASSPVAWGLVVGALAVANLATFRLYRVARDLERGS